MVSANKGQLSIIPNKVRSHASLLVCELSGALLALPAEDIVDIAECGISGCNKSDRSAFEVNGKESSYLDISRMLGFVPPNGNCERVITLRCADKHYCIKAERVIQFLNPQGLRALGGSRLASTRIGIAITRVVDDRGRLLHLLNPQLLS